MGGGVLGSIGCTRVGLLRPQPAAGGLPRSREPSLAAGGDRSAESAACHYREWPAQFAQALPCRLRLVDSGNAPVTLGEALAGCGRPVDRRIGGVLHVRRGGAVAGGGGGTSLREELRDGATSDDACEEDDVERPQASLVRDVVVCEVEEGEKAAHLRDGRGRAKGKEVGEGGEGGRTKVGGGWRR